MPSEWKKTNKVIDTRWLFEKDSGNRYCAKCVHFGEMLDGKPYTLEFHILHRCTLDYVSRVQYMRIVEYTQFNTVFNCIATRF